MAQGVAGTAFVGRRRELDDLAAALSDAARGRGRLVLVSGDPGMGKTRLAEELAVLARDRGLGVLWAGCTEGSGAPPLWPWVEVVRGLTDAGVSPDPKLSDLLTDGDSARRLLGDIDPAGARFRLFDRVVTCLRRVATANPSVLFIDDLHWADRSSLQLMLQLSASLRSISLVVVGMYRATEASAALEEMLARLPADVERRTVTGLGPGDVAALAAAVSGEDLDDEMAATLHDHTGGNPFFVRELVRLGLAFPSTIPDSVREVLERRLARLSVPCCQLLSVAAVIGREFDVDLLASVAGSQVDVGVHLDEAVNGRIVIEHEFDRFGFVHDLFRQALYDGLGRVQRLRLHLEVGRALVDRYGAEPSRRLGELAHHFLAAGPMGEPEAAIDYGRRAGERAARLLAFHEAIGYFERTLAVPGMHASERAALLLALGDAHWRAQDVAAARAVFTEVAGLARDLDDAELLAKAALGYSCGLGGNQPLAQADQTLVELLDEALLRLPDDDDLLRCRVLGRLAIELNLTEEVARRSELSADAVAMARRLGDASALAAALYARQIAVLGPDSLDERQAAADDILALADDAGDTELALWGYLFRVWVRTERCQPIIDDLATCARLAERLRLPGYQAEVALRQAIVAITAGDFDEVDRLLAIVDANSGSYLAAESSRVALMALKSWLQGPLQDIEPMVQALLVVMPEKRMWRAALAVLYAEQGRLDDARHEFEALASRGFDVPRDGLWMHAMYFLSFVCFAIGDAPRARELYDIVQPCADLAPVGVFGSMATPLGLLEATRGRYEEAFRWLNLGHERNLALGNRAYAMWGRRETAAVLLHRGGPGDRELARSQLEKLHVELRRVGFVGFLERTDALLAEAGEQPCLRLDASGWQATFGGVTARFADSKGIVDIAAMLARPGQEIAAVDLVGAVVAGDTGETLDARARNEMKARITELEEESEDAEAAGDVARAEKARAERDAIVHHLAAALGLGGKARRTGDVAERARKAVTWRVRQAIRVVGQAHPALGRHLDASVRTGTFCVYQPDPPIAWHVDRNR